ncbi:MAG: kinase/pyrophosphorylase [Planctomycetes bacterium]|nr:kinase/pyrophosphorylase [Planctomycetota bacterium]
MPATPAPLTLPSVATRQKPARTPTILIVSDGTGSTCSHVVNAALMQFERPDFRIVRKANVRTPEQARQAVEEAACNGAVIFYTLISESVREALHAAADRHLVPTVDLLGHVLASLAGLLKASPRCDPELLYELERKHIDRYDAVDFTLAHDDGLRAHELSQADVVLVGVSRASKSATCFVLASHGVRAANVPLIPGIHAPAELLELDPKKVIGLTVGVNRLKTIRAGRVSSMRMGSLDRYVDIREIAQEIRYANGLMEKYGWRSIDVSYKAVEEVAKEILRLIGREPARHFEERVPVRPQFQQSGKTSHV